MTFLRTLGLVTVAFAISGCAETENENNNNDVDPKPDPIEEIGSIVDVATLTPYVKRTLLVGDEPRDIVFTDPDGGGPLGDRAFITTAHRGQHRTDSSISGVPGAGDPQLTTEGIGRADVWVFDATSLGATLGGTPIEIVSRSVPAAPASKRWFSTAARIRSATLIAISWGVSTSRIVNSSPP